MLLLKRNHVALDRDVIFLAESGEEADTAGVGINFMVAEHYDEIDAEYSITEGGGATIEDGKVVTMGDRHRREGTGARSAGGYRHVRSRVGTASG